MEYYQFTMDIITFIMNNAKPMLYVSPKVVTVEINTQAIICQSVSTINDLNLLEEDDSDNWK